MRLNIGSGPDVRPGWWNCDRDWYPGLDWQGDILDGVPLPDGSADAVFAGHVLQMVAWVDLPRFLAEVRRLLAPGGVFRVVVPDISRAVEAWLAGNRRWFPIAEELEPSVAGAFSLYVTQAGATRSIFPQGYLHEVLYRAGFSQVRVCRVGVTYLGEGWIVELDSRADESMFVEATK